MAAELDAPVLIKLSNRNIILHDVLLHVAVAQHFKYHGQSYQTFGVFVKII